MFAFVTENGTFTLFYHVGDKVVSSPLKRDEPSDHLKLGDLHPWTNLMKRTVMMSVTESIIGYYVRVVIGMEPYTFISTRMGCW